MTALVVGTLLTLAALAFVLAPLYVGTGTRRVDVSARDTERPPANVALEALREIEFDRATGKLSDGDYASLKDRYTQEAVVAMRLGERPTPSTAIDDATLEATIAQVRARHECPEHGLRPEADALFCSDCGRYLPGVCRRCAAAVTEPESAYCASCGGALVEV
ncbi:MAG: hypothetical protein NVS1B4_18550 [Gemmatimonadaceae bacterium]